MFFRLVESDSIVGCEQALSGRRLIKNSRYNYYQKTTFGNELTQLPSLANLIHVCFSNA